MNPKTGYVDGVESGVAIGDVFIDLPPQRVQGVDIDVTTERGAQAVVYSRTTDFDIDDDGIPFSRAPPIVVFLHGFSQRPRNYESMLRLLAAHGYLVIAPRTWLFDVALPWQSVEGVSTTNTSNSSRPSPQAKLQSALLIDALRCVTWARQHVPGNAPISLLGHSMGGAMALVAARALSADIHYPVSSVAVLAPAIVGTALTEINRLLSWDDGGDMGEFAATFGPAPLFIANGRHDRVVKYSDTERLYQKFAEARYSRAIVGLCEILPGSHIGYEDSLRVDVGFLRILDTLLFKLIDLIVFRGLDSFFDIDEQLELTKRLLLVWLGEAGHANTSVDVIKEKMGRGVPSDEAKFMWDEEAGNEEEEQEDGRSEKRDV